MIQLPLKDCVVPQLSNAKANKKVVKHDEKVLFKCLEGFGTNDTLEFICNNGDINTTNAKCES